MRSWEEGEGLRKDSERQKEDCHCDHRWERMSTGKWALGITSTE